MDFTYCEFPSTVSIDTFKAYFNLSNVRLPNINSKSLDHIPNEVAAESESKHATKQMKTLRHLVLDVIIGNWSGKQGARERERVLNCFFFDRVATLPSAATTPGQKLPAQPAGYAATAAIAQLTYPR